MAVEWEEKTPELAQTEIGLVADLEARRTEYPDARWMWSVYMTGTTGRGYCDTLAAAKSAALAEARRLLAQAMEELGDG